MFLITQRRQRAVTVAVGSQWQWSLGSQPVVRCQVWYLSGFSLGIWTQVCRHEELFARSVHLRSANLKFLEVCNAVNPLLVPLYHFSHHKAWKSLPYRLHGRERWDVPARSCWCLYCTFLDEKKNLISAMKQFCFFLCFTALCFFSVQIISLPWPLSSYSGVL